LDWDEREDLFKMSGKIVRTSNITQSAVGNKDGLWTTVFAAAVFINEDNLSVESGKSQADAASGNEDANRDETSRPVPEAREPAPRQPEEPTKHHPAGSDEKAAHPAPAGQGHHLNATHDQQEVTKAVLRASQPRGEPSPRGKDASTTAEDVVLKAGRLRFPKPL